MSQRGFIPEAQLVQFNKLFRISNAIVL